MMTFFPNIIVESLRQDVKNILYNAKAMQFYPCVIDFSALILI